MRYVPPHRLAIDELQTSELSLPSQLPHTAPIDHAVVHIMMTKLPIWHLNPLSALDQPGHARQ